MASEPKAARLLDEIHAALKRREYGALATLEAALAAELDRPDPQLDATALALIRRNAERNAAILLATQRGMRAALRRLAEIRAVATGMGTYDRAGRRDAQGGGRTLTTRL